MVGIIDTSISGVLAAIVCAAPGGVMCLQVVIRLCANSAPG
jgi:hypothetical protein